LAHPCKCSVRGFSTNAEGIPASRVLFPCRPQIRHVHTYIPITLPHTSCVIAHTQPGNLELYRHLACIDTDPLSPPPPPTHTQTHTHTHTHTHTGTHTGARTHTHTHTGTHTHRRAHTHRHTHTGTMCLSVALILESQPP